MSKGLPDFQNLSYSLFDLKPCCHPQPARTEDGGRCIYRERNFTLQAREKSFELSYISTTVSCGDFNSKITYNVTLTLFSLSHWLHHKTDRYCTLRNLIKLKILLPCAVVVTLPIKSKLKRFMFRTTIHKHLNLFRNTYGRKKWLLSNILFH